MGSGRSGSNTHKTQATAGLERWSGLGDAIVSCMGIFGDEWGVGSWKAKGKYMQERMKSTIVGFTQASRSWDENSCLLSSNQCSEA